MQVDRARYTPSDIGPSPSDWGAPRLSEVSTLITNGFVGTASPFYSNETGVSYLYGNNVRANKIDLNNIRYITREFHQDQQKTSLRAGDLLTVQSGHIGETAVVPKHLENANCHALIVTRLKPKLVNSDFLCQYINSEIGIARLRGLGVGSTIAHINTKDLKKFRIPLPPLPEQKKIAAILSTWDRAIEGTEKLLANSQQQKKALMQQLLTGKKRLPGFTGEWKTVTIGSLLKEVKRPVEWKDDNFYKLLSVKRRSEGVVLREVLNGTKILTKKMNYAQSGDFLISKMQIVHGASGLVPEHLDNHHISDSYIALCAKNPEKFDIEFFSWLSKERVMYHKTFLCSYGVSIEKMTFNFNMYLKENIEIPPTVMEQRAISQLLNTTENEITAIESDLARLRQEKKALMQQLLTGKRRVKVN
ncbi:restriction endonuclease subunit S [Komagataeibacter swingsii]|uniref:restriction endonuclease subunit S n=1 Tax=Komagataeibacter swingsii TaxID=215220 RepID=UPI001C400187|nr:restriction endonuclease subunit S [Komagataeibacter swingsii]